jgi:hypothetical protein
MAEVASHHSDSTRDVDDLFQILVRARGKSPPLARRDILKQLQDGALPIMLHIKGGVRSIGPVRPPTPEERVKEKRTGKIAKARYGTTPRKGVTSLVDSQSWDSILLLRIRGEKLVIEPGCAFDYPWGAYNFTIANWSLVEELWPNPRRLDPPAPAPETAPPSPPVEPETAPLSPPVESEVAPKVSREDWIYQYLTEDRQKDLVKRHNHKSAATREMYNAMRKDPRVEPYARARNIERHPLVQKLFPSSKPKKKKG